MRLGLSTATFFLKEQTEDTFDLIKRLGLDLSEVFLTTFSEYEGTFVEILKERKSSVEVHSVHAYNTAFEPQLFNLADRTRLDGEYYFKKVLTAGRAIGANYYTFHGQARLKKSSKIDIEWTGKRTEELWQMAKHYDIELCFENVHWAHFNCPEFFTEIKKYSPNIKACLDIKQAMQSEVDYTKYLEVMGDRLKTVHISDYDEMGKTCLIGRGVFDFKTLFKRLNDSGYTGPILIEQYARDYENYSELKKAVDYIKEILYGINA